MKGQQVVKCPHCRGNKVKSSGTASKRLFWLGVISCITLIGIPAGLILILTYLLMKRSKLRLNFICQKCKRAFKVNEDVYQRYVKSIS
ncbi:hypothetical protein D0469_18890 [Peribacillus saganii]|uniref:LITAF domain-containing protein n=1 Tax=Peribacillus saganii TaxID=2303992 RepID=A0A372LE08_9BACI|nr:hypothetical protein D0469_18890 [Peribacillus saganii]